MKNKILLTILGLVLLIPLVSLTSTSNAKIISNESILIAYGNGHEGKNKLKYNTTSFIYHIGIKIDALFPSFNSGFSKRITLYLEPQYTKVRKPAGNYEVGIGVGVEYKFPIARWMKGYFLIGSGLHYISFGSKYQSRGFNFNDNIGVGAYIFLSKHTALNVGFRFRHISNADINPPNEGINSYLFISGISYFFN